VNRNKELSQFADWHLAAQRVPGDSAMKIGLKQLEMRLRTEKMLNRQSGETRYASAIEVGCGRDFSP
jgi:hypothetical protein